MRIAVLGASGFVGSAIVSAVREAGHEVVEINAPRLRVRSRGAHSILEEVRARYAHEGKLLAARLESVTTLVNAAGSAAPGSPMTDDLVGANSALPCLMVLAALEANVTRVVHVSSAAVYGGAGEPSEASDPIPDSPYGRSKLWGEQTSRLAAESSDNPPSLIIYRPTSVHGAGRSVTTNIRRLAGSPFASVCYPGDQPTPQVLVESVGEYALGLATQEFIPGYPVVHPYEGWTTASFLTHMGTGRVPFQINPRIASCIVRIAKLLGKTHASVAVQARRLEMLWFGQNIHYINSPKKV